MEDELTRVAATVVGEVIGTIEYMAPEQARGEHVDQRADVYAFGLIVYDMLVGKRRSEHAVSAVGELQKRLAQTPPPVRTLVPAVPEALDALVTKCVEPDPAKRYQTTAELVAALDLLDDNGKLKPKKRVGRDAARGCRRLGAADVVRLHLLGHAAARSARSGVGADRRLRKQDRRPGIRRHAGADAQRALEGASFISAYDRSRIGTLGVQTPEQLDETTARTLAANQALGVVISGTLDPLGSGYRISVKAIHAVTGNVITTASADAPAKNNVLEAATRLMTRVRNALGDETSESAQLFAMRSVSTSSLEVVSHYAAAVEAQARGDFETARQSYQKAVEVDPKFALGYLGLAAMSRNLQDTENFERYTKEALRYLDTLTDREQFATRGFYFGMMGDNPRCVKEFGDLLAKYPADVVAHNQRALCLRNLRKMREAIDEMRQATRVLPNHVTLRSNLALFEDYAGQFDNAEKELQGIQQPGRGALLALAYSQIGRGLIPDAKATYEKMATMGPQGASLTASGLGDLALYEGRFSDSVRIFEEGARADLDNKSADRAALKLAAAAYAHLMAGRNAPAITSAQKALTLSKILAVRFLAARVLVEAGSLDKARPEAAALSSATQAESQAHGKIIEGQIALRAGKTNDAIKILTEANGILDTWFGHFELGRAYLKAQLFVEADSEFHACMERRGETLSLMDEDPTYGYFPPVHYYLGLAREGVGTASFADWYGRYHSRFAGTQRKTRFLATYANASATSKSNPDPKPKTPHGKRESETICGLLNGPARPARGDAAMPRKGRSNEEIVHALHQVDGGEKVAEVCRRLGVSEQTFYRWKKQFAGLGVQELRELRSLRDENRKLKQVVADLTLDRHILQEIVRKKL